MKFTARVFALVLVAGLSGCKKDELQAALDEANAALNATQADLESEQKSNAKLRDGIKTHEEHIAELEGEIEQLEKQIDSLAREAGLSAKELADLRREKAKREAELQVYRDLIGELRGLIDAGTITIEFRKGRMVVKMANSILFDSGKTKLKEEGQSALGDLAKALSSIKGRDFLVAGHTDNIPIRNARFRSNWSLSTARAVEVVDNLISQGMSAQHLGAAGFGEYDPVGDNTSAAGQAENRRIEIILMPRLGAIPGMQEMLMGAKKRKR